MTLKENALELNSFSAIDENNFLIEVDSGSTFQNLQDFIINYLKTKLSNAGKDTGRQ